MEFLRRIRVGRPDRGLMISLALHGVVIAALLIHLPAPEPAPEEPVVEVTLVSPPEPEPEAPEPVPEQPEPEAPEQAAPEPEPAPPEPETPEPEAPEAETPEQAGAPPPAPEVAGATVPIPVLRPVFQFGERDAGPRQALDGASPEEPVQPQPSDAAPAAKPSPLEDAAEAAPDPSAQTGPAQADLAQSEPAQADPAASAPESPTPEAPDPDAPAPETPDPEAPEPEIAGISLPEIALPESLLEPGGLGDAEPDGPQSAALAEAVPAARLPAGTVPDPDAAASTTSGPGGPATDAAAPVELAEARKLFSPVLTEDRAAMVAMGSLPRELRASQLCTTELREQLRNGPTRYGVELLPSYRLDSGNVLAVGDAAFRADGAWYDLSFRCTVDDDAFKVAGFALKVGAAIPRAQWKSRGFPDF